MIRFGPAGIPLSCKGRTVRDGILYTRALELDAMEVQFVRGIRMTEEEAIKIREAAEACDVELHVKAPYYINLAGDEQNIQRSFQKIVATGALANLMGAETVVFHPGFYGDLDKEETMNKVVENLREIRNVFIREGWKPRLGLEIMGKRNVFGSLEEAAEVCRRVKGVVPVIDMAHIHARGNGALQEADDFLGIFDRLSKLRLKHYLIHFTGVHYENGNTRYRIPIKKGDLKFEPLCDVILDHNFDATILSTSPIMEHDAMYMNIVFDRSKERRDQRLAREIREKEEAEDKARKEEERRLEREEAKRLKEEERARKKAEADAKKEAARAARAASRDVIQSDDSGRRQVSVGEYKLYRKENRFYFMKEKRDGFSVVYKVPDGKEVGFTKNGTPVIRNLPEPKPAAKPAAKAKAPAKAAKAPAKAAKPVKKAEPALKKPKVLQSDDSGRRQVQVDEYKLYKKENRFYFMKAKKEGFNLVFKVPEGKEIVYNKNNIPLIRNLK
ncbi:MAG: TIM barrel protein [Thermoplasmatota archaeon]